METGSGIILVVGGFLGPECLIEEWSQSRYTCCDNDDILLDSVSQKLGLAKAERKSAILERALLTGPRAQVAQR